MKRIVLGYSGGLDTSAAIPWLTERSASRRDPVEVVAVILDLGRRAELVELRTRALSLGAVRCHVVDVREELVGGYILPALQTGAFAYGRSAMTVEIARPLVAKTLVDIARMEGAGAIAFGGAAGFDPAPLDPLIASLNPALERITLPAQGRDEISANLWGRRAAFAPGATVPDDFYVLTCSADESPDDPAYVEIEFHSGVPSRVNGIEMPLVEMIESLEIIGGTHGSGRADVLVERGDGSTWREISEAPAAILLQRAHVQLQSLLLDSELARSMEHAGRAYAGLIQGGAWFSPAREEIDAFVSTVRPGLTGSIRLRLFKGDCGTVPSLVNS